MDTTTAHLAWTYDPPLPPPEAPNALCKWCRYEIAPIRSTRSCSPGTVWWIHVYSLSHKCMRLFVGEPGIEMGGAPEEK